MRFRCLAAGAAVSLACLAAACGSEPRPAAGGVPARETRLAAAAPFTASRLAAAGPRAAWAGPRIGRYRAYAAAGAPGRQPAIAYSAGPRAAPAAIVGPLAGPASGRPASTPLGPGLLGPRQATGWQVLAIPGAGVAVSGSDRLSAAAVAARLRRAA